MDSRKPIQFTAIPDGDLRCRTQVPDVYDKKVQGCTFKIEINKAEIGSVSKIEKYCDGNPFKMIIRNNESEDQISFHVKNKNDFSCDSRETDGGKVIVHFVSVPITVARREISSIDTLWNILQASTITVNMEPAQLPIPGLEDDGDGEADSVDDDFADTAEQGKRGRGKK